MNTEQNNNQSFETILSTDERILCKRNHVRYHNYICGIVAGLLIWLYGFSCLEHGNLKNALTIGGLLLVAIFLLRIVLEKKVFIEKCNGARLTFKKKTYLLSDEKKLKKLKEKAINEGKPEAIAEKIVLGGLNKFYKEICLEEQAFIKDSGLSVLDYVKNNGGVITSMNRYAVGEGIEKRQDNFAEEVMAQING